MDKVFELEISRPGSFGANTSTLFALPATPYEILDALDKARITDERVIYSMEITSCKLDYLPQFIIPSTNLYELNHLAQRLEAMSQWELDCFEGLTMMDTIHTDYAPIAVERLINMTHSLDNCQIAYEAHDNESLGRFYADNGFVPVLDGLPENVFAWLDYEKIGKEMYDGEGGVFTPSGYVVQNGEILPVYHSGEAIHREKPDYAVLLKVTKGCFNDPEYDNDLVTFMKLPANEDEVCRAAQEVNAASPKECAFAVVDCTIPRLSEKITDELENGNLNTVWELSVQLKRLSDDGSIPTFKAMLESAPNEISLEDALDLAYQAGEFRLLREIASPEDYAKAELAKCNIPLKEELLQSQNLYRYGEKLMEMNQAIGTDYGILYSPDGRTVEQCLVLPGQHMQMGGQS
ncbi:hypothetical protein SDC9_56375 [bioreactor metagenome]|uniref:Antirestriction protein ArdA n=1 Tax=bioreactor metagenome TaxID=1076179 RepID=A0A644X2E2_9ZZZZ|nr:hypothetical protein [Clostridiaceae bacterium]